MKYFALVQRNQERIQSMKRNGISVDTSAQTSKGAKVKLDELRELIPEPCINPVCQKSVKLPWGRYRDGVACSAECGNAYEEERYKKRGGL